MANDSGKGSLRRGGKDAEAKYRSGYGKIIWLLPTKKNKGKIKHVKRST